LVAIYFAFQIFCILRAFLAFFTFEKIHFCGFIGTGNPKRAANGKLPLQVIRECVCGVCVLAYAFVFVFEIGGTLIHMCLLCFGIRFNPYNI